MEFFNIIFAWCTGTNYLIIGSMNWKKITNLAEQIKNIMMLSDLTCLNSIN